MSTVCHKAYDVHALYVHTSSIVIVEPGDTQFVIAWSPGLTSADCAFQAWEVKVRSRNLNGSLVGTWRDADECNAIPLRDAPSCNVMALVTSGTSHCPGFVV
eukprot:s2010_g10.t1